MLKDDVRRIARERGLRVAEKPDSQEICFVPDGDYASVVERRLPADRAGLMIDTGGRVLGRHEGVHHFTIGQRKGLGLALGDPVYVVRLDAEKKLVVVGPRSAIEQTALTASRVNWISGTPPADTLDVSAQIRNRHAAAPARATALGPDRVRVDFDTPQLAITPGQAVVLFRGDEVLGGGWIDSPGAVRS
jgi:tRNA-specific 2-thiouridylase